ncbi:MAG: response regulator transcription factor [Frankia sp.]|nr:response regulator transcription factor [Frankia sp.]
MAQPVIAVIEDDATIADAVAVRLRREGFTVECASDGLSGVELCKQLHPDLVVLDLMLPGIDGVEACRRIQRDRAVPVVMLTARDEEADVVVGLGIGADDYITKPFSHQELVARIRAVLRRSPPAAVASSTLRVGELQIDPDRRRVLVAGRDVHLTPTEFDLLVRLAARPGVVHSRRQLMTEVWGYRDGRGERAVDTHVAALRRKLGGDVVRTVHGVGYAAASAP